MSSLPARMRVARLHAWGDVRIEEELLPRPARGEIVVRIDACGVCGSDGLVWYVELKAPTVLGHEPAGVVAAVGAGVSQVREGDRVFVHHHAPCGACRECRLHLWSSCETWRAPHLWPGGFSQFARVSATAVAMDTLHLPDALDTESATFIEPLACCLRAVRRGRITPDDAVFVIGLGAMGLLMTRLARIQGARTVIGSDFLEERRSLGRAFGAERVIDAGDASAHEAVREATAGRGADVVLVCPPTRPAFESAVSVAAPGARIVCFTPIAPGAQLSLDQNALYFREIELLQSYSCGPDETRAALDLLAAGQIDVRRLVTHRAGLDGVADALERARGKGAGLKTLILPHGAT